MKVEIWSDVVCPFCYIGKKRFEKALSEFPGKSDVEVEWKSFQLNPNLETVPGKTLTEHLAEIKGWSIEQAREANAYVTDMARGEGLNYDLDHAVVASSYNAHRLIQLAKKSGLADAMEERLFKAYFTDGLNIDDMETLVRLGVEAGLDATAVKTLLVSDKESESVATDIYESRQIGVRGVPYFVFNDRYAVNGAQSPETFAGALEKAFGEWQKEGVSKS